jgi:hypothetical protein
MGTKTILLTCLFIILLIVEFKGQSPTKPQLTLTVFAQGFTRPADIKNCGDSRLFIVQQTGKISIIDSLGKLKPHLSLTSRVKLNPAEVNRDYWDLPLVLII